MTTSLVCSDFPTLVGRQEPHHLSEFEGDDESHGERAIELARRVRRLPMPWQQDSLRAILRQSCGLWTHPDFCLIVPRQNGKTLIAAIRILYGLFVLGERIIYSAQRWPTAEDVYKRVDGMIKARPSLNARVVQRRCSQGQGYFELQSGAKAAFITRSNDSGRGFDEVDLVLYDEGYNLTDGQISAISWTQMASRNPQTGYLSSAVNEKQHTNGLVLSAMRQRGLAHGEGLYLAEYMAPEEMPRDELETARYANPSYGVIQNDAKIIKALRAAVTAEGRESYDVECLGRGVWPVEVEETPPLFDMGVWARMGDHAGVRPAVVGRVGVGIDRHHGVFAVAAAQRTDDGRIRVEVGFMGKSDADAIAAVAAIDATGAVDAFALKSTSPAMSLVPGLHEADIEPKFVTGPQMQQGCVGFMDDFEAHRLSHSDDGRLRDSLLGLRKWESKGGSFEWDYSVDAQIAAGAAATLARIALLNHGTTETEVWGFWE